MPENKKLTEFRRIRLAFMIANVAITLVVIALAIVLSK